MNPTLLIFNLNPDETLFFAVPSDNLLIPTISRANGVLIGAGTEQNDDFDVINEACNKELKEFQITISELNRPFQNVSFVEILL